MFRNNRQNIEEIYFPCTFDSIFYEKVIKFNMINITKVGPTYFTFKTAPTIHNIHVYMYSEIYSLSDNILSTRRTIYCSISMIID